MHVVVKLIWFVVIIFYFVSLNDIDLWHTGMSTLLLILTVLPFLFSWNIANMQVWMSNLRKQAFDSGVLLIVFTWSIEKRMPVVVRLMMLHFLFIGRWEVRSLRDWVLKNYSSWKRTLKLVFTGCFKQRYGN